MAFLPRRQAVLIEMHYRGDVDLKDIAGTPGSPSKASRVSQLHTEALRAMRAYFLSRGKTAA